MSRPIATSVTSTAWPVSEMTLDQLTRLLAATARDETDGSTLTKDAYPGIVFDLTTESGEQFHVIVRAGRARDVGPGIRV